ncbi:YggT family protein [Neomoorella thermoacetica]|uniref:YGGT family protein n=3 Tax=Neomoorella thermoacetica TaxID=1525 RepID=A0A1D7X9J7_NEOTH|nr:YggT family protein [Moorella thermoacetica]AKX93611.1 YGGT family protein [Moorella thermoacetica]AKX96258.1 YGGT family protein [Moorella thermoacetica]AOQ23526.1 YGGT family protein [Moorella thermoacetica]APC07982.1 YGGT family protein [Moorella thermoacetica]OIQ09735.1 YGGT family protein [Moorella thermoacetica]
MQTLAVLVRVAFEVLNWLIIARILISWFPHDPNHPIMRFIYEITEPVLAPFRRIMPRTTMPIDFSPIIAVLVLQLVEHLLINFIMRLG